jgi:hypothetical protein
MVMQNPEGEQSSTSKNAPPAVELTVEILDQMRRRRQMLDDLRRWSEARQRQEAPRE